jgi:citrate lyase gamma subunit
MRSIVALRGSVAEGALVELLDSSFAVWQRRQAGLGGWNVEALHRDLDALVTAQLLDREPSGLLTLTALGRYAGESGLEVRSVTQVASALRGSPQVLSVADLITLAQVTVELDALRIRYHKRSTQERQRWPAELARSGVAHGIINMLHVGGADTTLRAKRAAACLLFMSPVNLGQIERHLLQHVPVTSAAGPIRQIAARTRDVIDAVAQVAQFYGRGVSDDWDSVAVGLQLELGLPSEMATIGRAVGNALSRGQYLTLLTAGITTLEQVVSIDKGALEDLLGARQAAMLLGRANESAN